MEFSRQEYWSGLPFPSPEDLPDHVSCVSCMDRQILYQLSHRGMGLYLKSHCQTRSLLSFPVLFFMPFVEKLIFASLFACGPLSRVR